MVIKKVFYCLRLMVFFFFLVFLSPYGQVWAGHDQGQGKSQHPEQDISVAPEPSGIILFSVGGVIMAYRYWKKKRD